MICSKNIYSIKIYSIKICSIHLSLVTSGKIGELLGHIAGLPRVPAPSDRGKPAAAQGTHTEAWRMDQTRKDADPSPVKYGTYGYLTSKHCDLTRHSWGFNHETCEFNYQNERFIQRWLGRWNSDLLNTWDIWDNWPTWSNKLTPGCVQKGGKTCYTPRWQSWWEKGWRTIGFWAAIVSDKLFVSFLGYHYTWHDIVCVCIYIYTYHQRNMFVWGFCQYEYFSKWRTLGYSTSLVYFDMDARFSCFFEGNFD